MSVDETDRALMRRVAAHVCDHVGECFGEPPWGLLHWAPATEVVKTGEGVAPFLRLIELTMAPLYRKHKGDQWTLEKQMEMREPGIVYVWIEDARQVPVAFVTVKVVLNDGMVVLYLYEIHVLPRYHGKRLGAYLINGVHQLTATVTYPYPLQATCLTVFSDNHRALVWYTKLGYRLSRSSPTDIVLRGRIKKPQCYYMERLIALSPTLKLA